MKKIILLVSLLIVVLGIGYWYFRNDTDENKKNEEEKSLFIITSPYDNVDWDTIGHFKADLHVHTTNSILSEGFIDECDGASLAEVIEHYYERGFDILGIADHNFVTYAWRDTPGGLTREREEEIMSGVGRGGRGMFQVPFGIEQTEVEHFTSFFANHINHHYALDNLRNRVRPIETFDNMLSVIYEVEKLGGISFINHPGRYTGGNRNLEDGELASNNPETIQRYVDMFMRHPSVIGMEIVNQTDLETLSDRILWDNILKQTMPEGRFVWGFANSDRHFAYHVGWAFNIMLIDEDDLRTNGRRGIHAVTDNAIHRESLYNPIRRAMETGAFYAVAVIARRENVNSHVGEDEEEKYLYLVNNNTPRITRITSGNDKITIEGNYYNVVEWIADGKIIATGNTLNLRNHSNEINSYVRAQLKSSYGIAFTQPFRIEKR